MNKARKFTPKNFPILLIALTIITIQLGPAACPYPPLIIENENMGHYSTNNYYARVAGVHPAPGSSLGHLELEAVF